MIKQILNFGNSLLTNTNTTTLKIQINDYFDGKPH